MSNHAEFYDEFEKTLLGIYSRKPANSFREWEPSWRVPFYETQLWGGYLTETYDYGHRHNYLNKTSQDKLETWRAAMEYTKWGFVEKLEFADLMRVRANLIGGHVVTAPWILKCCHHYSSYERLTGTEINSFERIVEWGGGAGDFARFVFDMGFKGEYVLADLPGTSLISKANLSDKPDFYNVTWTTTPPPSSDKKTLFVSTWALSETPMDLRTEVLKTVDPDNWLIIYQREIWGYDNNAYFIPLWGKREEIPWIRWDGGSQLIAY